MKIFQRIISVPGLSNLGVVSEGKVYRSAQPDWESSYGSLDSWIPFKAKSVLNLREAGERQTVEGLGLKYFQLRLKVLSDVTVDDFDLIVQVLSNPENQPILVHCLQGHDRTGMACAAYRMAVDGWTLDEAWEEAKVYGFNNLWFGLRWHLEKYAAAKGFPLC